ncbi:MAG: SUMF1/EgtB/PvdO family nonheme iron enzyme [Nitrospiraceae bacterium]|nr:SUMF1/EgtB/PvdO family nonheme iron enzyme [Nitrospiraceae bacterium]
MKKIFVLVALLGLDADPTMSAALFDERAKKFSAGYDFLNQQKYQEARTAFEAGLQQYPANALAHFYLGDACRGLKSWACAETHYETSLELDSKSSVAGLAKQRGRSATVWHLLDEGKQAMSASNASPQKIAQAEDSLDLAKRLGLDDEQQALYQQLHEKIQQEPTPRHEKTASAQSQERSMAVVQAGEFIMGSVTGDADEQPVRRVYVDAFSMDRYQVSVGQYAKFLEATSQSAPPDWSIMNKSRHQNRPVVNVDWADADAYCTWAGKRLPTEAEWEKAARGTDGRTYPWGNELPTGVRANSKKEKWSDHWALTPVGMYEEGKSPYGIYDMAGNVWEWVSDWYDPDYYMSSPSKNPRGPLRGESKVIRGGSWGSGPRDLRASDRDTHVPSARGMGTGFRCAKTP